MCKVTISVAWQFLPCYVWLVDMFSPATAMRNRLPEQMIQSAYWWHPCMWRIRTFRQACCRQRIFSTGLPSSPIRRQDSLLCRARLRMTRYRYWPIRWRHMPERPHRRLYLYIWITHVISWGIPYGTRLMWFVRARWYHQTSAECSMPSCSIRTVI